jgi:transposase
MSAIRSLPGVNRTWPETPDTVAIDPGRVKTQSVLWFPLLSCGGMMKGFVQGADRQQTTLLPECLDDWVGESNPVRAVDVFVDALELRDLGFDGVDPAATGRPAYHPSPMLKLYIYGYLNRVQSSRRLEREAGRNLEVMWLTGRLVPDHKTIADFPKDNGPAIRRFVRGSSSCAARWARWRRPALPSTGANSRP